MTPLDEWGKASDGGTATAALIVMRASTPSPAVTRVARQDDADCRRWHIDLSSNGSISEDDKISVAHLVAA